MTQTVQSTDLRRRVREVLDRVRLGREPVIIRSYNTPQAVIIPYEDFEAFKQWQADRQQRAAWLAELQQIAAEVSARAALSENEADALINAAVRAARDE
jgi:prevent-host-death family protein